MLWDGRYRGGARDACFGPGEREDAAAAEAFCARFGIPYVRLDRAALYESAVIAPWRRAFLEGRVDGDRYALILRITNLEMKSIITT